MSERVRACVCVHLRALPFFCLNGRVRFQGLGRERLRVSAHGCSSTVGFVISHFLFSFELLRILTCAY